MKKPRKPFTFEVKRSRLASPKASTFQRYVVAPGLDAARRTPDTSWLQVAIRGEPSSPPVPARILPSLLGERIWTTEPDVPPQAMHDVTDGSEIGEEPEAPGEDGPVTLEITVPPRDLPQQEPDRSKPVRHRAKSPDDLPRGERWKRRLPRAAW